MRQCRFTRHRLNAPHAACHARFSGNPEKTDVARARDVGATTKLYRKAIIAHCQHPDFIAIFFAKERHGARSNGVIHAHQFRGHFCVGTHLFVHHRSDAGEGFSRYRLTMGKIKAQALGIDQRAFLQNVISQLPSQRFVQEMRRRVVKACPITQSGIDLGINRVPHLDRARRDRHMVQVMPLRLGGIGDISRPVKRTQTPTVTYLSATLSIKRCAIQNHDARLISLQRCLLDAVD